MELTLSVITFIVAGAFGYILGRNEGGGQSPPSSIEHMKSENNRLEKEVDKQFSDPDTDDIAKSSIVVTNCFICHGSGVAFNYDAYGGGSIPCSCDAGDRVTNLARQGSSNRVLGRQLRKFTPQEAEKEFDQRLQDACCADLSPPSLPQERDELPSTAKLLWMCFKHFLRTGELLVPQSQPMFKTRGM